MRQNRSADPWSAFLRPPGRQFDTGYGGPAPRVAAGPGGGPVSSFRDGDPDETGLPEACRRILARLTDSGRPQSLEQLQHGTGLGLLEIADAVESLRDRGLVTVEREIDEIVRLTPPADR
ncbi:hypothetical protein FHU30_003918 [Actinomadura rupiterrae]|nr:hypothetical protein [Actinomadura rupiterrae]